MNRDDILKAVQKEQQKNGEFEKLIVRKGISYATTAGILFLLFMIALELLVVKKLDFGKPTLIFVMCGVSNLYEGFHGGTRRQKITGISEIILTVFSFIIYLGVSII